MATLSTVTLGVSKTGGIITDSGTITHTNTDAPVNHTTQTFAANTFAAVAFPALIGSATIKGVIIKPPSSNTGTITLKGVTGDTGFPIHKTEETYIRLFGVTASNFGILCSADTTIEFEWV